MKSIFTFTSAIMLAQLISAQSLTPANMASTARLSVKPNASLTASMGELTLKVANIAPAKNEVKEETVVMDVFPNPANNVVSFNFQMAGQGKISVSLTNSLGQKVEGSFEGNYDNGKITESLDISNCAPGMYFLTLQFSDASGKLHHISKRFQII